jgi:hypothetical protein
MQIKLQICTYKGTKFCTQVGTREMVLFKFVELCRDKKIYPDEKVGSENRPT